MAVQEIIQVLSGVYTPTNAYSWEFTTPSNQSITEVFALLPPDDLSVSEPTRSELAKTVGGGYLADFGNDFKKITVKWSPHFFYAGSPSAGGNPTVSARSSAMPFVNGYEEFIKLRYLAIRFRDYTLTPRASLGRVPIPPALYTNASLLPTTRIGLKVRNLLTSKKGALYDQVQLIWHAYDFDDHYYVQIESFDWNITNRDPFTVSVSISMIAYQVATARLGVLNPSAGTLTTKKPAREKIRKVMLYIGDLAPATKPDTLPARTDGSQILIPTS